MRQINLTLDIRIAWILLGRKWAWHPINKAFLASLGLWWRDIAIFIPRNRRLDVLPRLLWDWFIAREDLSLLLLRIWQRDLIQIIFHQIVRSVRTIDYQCLFLIIHTLQIISNLSLLGFETNLLKQCIERDTSFLGSA